MRKIAAIILITLILAGCTQSNDMVPTAAETPVVTPAITMDSSNTPAPTNTQELNNIEPTSTPIPTDTPEPTATETPMPTVSSYCDYDQAMLVVRRLDELSASSGNNQNVGEITDEQIQEVLKAFDERIIELDQMEAPDCLRQSIDLMKASFVHMRQMFSGESDDIFALLVTISEDQTAFEAEYARVKACIPTGCQ